MLLLVRFVLNYGVVDETVCIALFEEFAHVLFIIVLDTAKCGDQDSLELWIHDAHDWIVV